MADPLPFPQAPLSRAARARARVLHECLDVTFGKEVRTRRFWIRPGQREGEWFCQVWFGTQTQHRGEATEDWQKVHRLKSEYFREMDELERDGWQIVAGADPRPAKTRGVD